MKTESLATELNTNTYPGRGIVLGKTADGKKAVIAYFIMGRSVNSRNRIFEVNDRGGIRTKAFDESKMEDPSLIIYSPIKVYKNIIIVTNGDQTDTVFEGLKRGVEFKKALETRCFEPDAPNLTPRISGMVNFEHHDFSYEMSVLKSMDAQGSSCARYTFSYGSMAGLGHFIHTYMGDGNPLPSFVGEPKRVIIPDTKEDLFEEIWENLNGENRISLHVRYVDIETLESEKITFNRNTQ